MRGQMHILIAVAMTLMPCRTVAQEEPTVDGIRARCIDAMGGRASIERLTARVCVGHVLTDLTWKDPQVQEERFVAWATARHGLCIVTEDTNGTMAVEVADADSAWGCTREGVRPQQDLARSKLAWLLDPQNALRIEEYFPGLELRGREAVEGRDVWVLEPLGMDPVYWRLAFDVETGLLTHIGYYWKLEEYRDVDGVLFPFRVTESRKGGSTMHRFDHVWHEAAR